MTRSYAPRPKRARRRRRIFFVAFIGPDENDAVESALAAIGTVRFPQTAGIGVTIRFE